jgi:long-chain acyl-CoA synthetase
MTMPELDTDARHAAIMKGTAVSYWATVIPDAPALIEGDRVSTFADLNARANQLVRALHARGIGAGDGVALLCANRTEFAEVVTAADRSGLRLTPVNWHLTTDEAAYILDDCEARVIVADARFAEVAASAATLVAALTVRLAIGGGIRDFDDYDDVLARQPGDDIDDPVIGTRMLYTSGTTGRPKGVDKGPASAVPAAIASAASAKASGYQPGRGQLHLCTGPLYHAAPLQLSLVVPHTGGVGVVLMDGWDAEETLRLIERHRITHTHMVPTMFHRLLSLPPEVKARHDISSLSFVVHGAAPCPVPVKQGVLDWWGPIVVEYYAATEGAGTVVRPDEWLKRPGTVGKPEAPDHVRILDADGNRVPAGEVGTVYLHAPEQARFDYFKDTAKTAKAYRGDYYTLGDIGYLDDEGYLFLTDRSANLIISGGVNIYPAEVEAVLITHPVVGDVGVVGVPHDDWGEEVVAVVELQPGVESNAALAADLLEWCAPRLARFKRPRRVEFTDELPRHDNGKLYRQVLRDRYRAAAGA